MFTDAGGAEKPHRSSVDTPPHGGQRGQQTNHNAGCRGGGGVTKVRVAALESKTGNLEKDATETSAHIHKLSIDLSIYLKCYS